MFPVYLHTMLTAQCSYNIQLSERNICEKTGAKTHFQTIPKFVFHGKVWENVFKYFYQTKLFKTLKFLLHKSVVSAQNDLTTFIKQKKNYL